MKFFVLEGLKRVVTMKPRIAGLALFTKSQTTQESFPRLFATTTAWQKLLTTIDVEL
jgi:hypothetical protein